jgi:hypothetical protein
MCKIEETLELAEAVLEWANYDDFVAVNGWIDDVEEKWDKSKVKMVSIAREISDKLKGVKNVKGRC